MTFNKAQVIIFGAIGLVVLLAVLMLTGVIPGVKPRQPPPFTLEIWSPNDEEELWEDIAADHREKEGASATIKFQRKNPDTYEIELINALASGQGPDIFWLEDSDLEKHGDKLTPLAEGELGYQKKNLRSVFADALVEAVTDARGQLLATPLYFDTLALLYNRDYFNSANIPAPPQTWEELAEQSRRLTKFSEVGSITRSGIALGTAANVDHAADIMLALIYQANGEIIAPGGKSSAIDNPATLSALLFYTSFANAAKKTYSWNAFFDNSLAAFAKGETVMAFGYAADVKKVSELNPQLNFDAAPLPQQSKENSQTNFGRFGVLAVSRLSKESDNAWRFLLWLQGKDVEKKYIDALGLPPARRDLVGTKPPAEYLVTFYDQVLSARTAPVIIASSLPKILKAMIEAVVNKKFSINEAVRRADTDLNRVLRPNP